jgi:hypothetical protein
MRGAGALLAIALLCFAPIVSAIPARASASCAMSCCAARAHACPMRGGTSCRACTRTDDAHASAIAKVVIATPMIAATLTPRDVSFVPIVANVTSLCRPPATPPPQG